MMEMAAELILGALVVGLLLAEGLDRVYRLHQEITGRSI